MDGAADPHNLADVDVAVVKGVLGVAENAATWVAEADVVHRVLPFIAQNLVIILHEADIVPTLHEAYARLNIRESNYGVFIAGPSKTADIEQSLVIGAHGARSLTVVVVGEGV
jgi:L-lactate dehydrogenase complex protein LldG